ncbi:unnamed protein product [Euphydryas editha]|uniref:DUF4817 domain-containing protein n=1 Tax=Euphydryas editha TaxID=104508 RepID=A0AAU9TRA8_EUPED|nr:unnamed protein product [Euphydryas editha]
MKALSTLVAESTPSVSFIDVTRYSRLLRAQRRAFCVRAFYKNNDSYTIVRRLYRTHFNLTSLKHVPSVNLIKHWVCKFEETGNTMPDKSSGRKRTSRTGMNVDRVHQSVTDDPRQSLRLRAASLNLNKSTVHRILSKDLHFHPYKIVIVQEMKPDDPSKRVEFCRTMKNSFRSFNNIWFSDESNFTSTQDGATSHVTNQSLAALHDLFPGRVISRRGDINWPPRSPDLTPADFFLWGYLKSKVYNPLQPNLSVLKQRITEEINSIPRAMLKRVIENFSSRLNECEQVNGAHLQTVVFHKKTSRTAL